MTPDSPATSSAQGGISIFKLLEAPAKARFETLSDGIFAVAMTILVLDLRLPQLPHDVTSLQMFSALFALWPKVGAFIISFLFLAKTWDVQRLVIHAVERVDYPFVVMNVLLLLVCCFLPFSTSLVAEYPHVSFAAVVYLANMIALPCFNYAMWFHATRKHRLVKKRHRSCRRAVVRQKSPAGDNGLLGRLSNRLFQPAAKHPVDFPVPDYHAHPAVCFQKDERPRMDRISVEARGFAVIQASKLRLRTIAMSSRRRIVQPIRNSHTVFPTASGFSRCGR
jgi:uncharacterized membrane protein